MQEWVGVAPNNPFLLHNLFECSCMLLGHHVAISAHRLGVPAALLPICAHASTVSLADSSNSTQMQGLCLR